MAGAVDDSTLNIVVVIIIIIISLLIETVLTIASNILPSKMFNFDSRFSCKFLTI